MGNLLTNMNNYEDWEKIFNIFNDGIYITNAKGLTLKVNTAYENITGIPAKKLIGKYMEDIVKEGLLSTSITQKVMDTKQEVIEEQEINNGKRVILRGIPIFDREEIRMVVTFVRDNTVIRQIQEELNRSRIMADQYKKRLKELDKKEYIAESKEFETAISLAHKVANVDSTVLILGESGTGKEVIAREIHSKSHRSNQPFLKINCGAIPENLLESELFGYEGGAFTGAKKNGHIGVFELASKGTVFLDEIGDMPLVLQVKLLRVLQEKTITRIGSSKPVKIDTRVIAATNLNLEKMIKEKKFREDLYYRLNVVVIKSPPLRERKTDIPGLVDLFVGKLNEKYNFSKRISPGVLKELMEYDWPGNVRELENMIERILVTSEQDEIVMSDELLFWKQSPLTEKELEEENNIIPLKEAYEKVEKKILLEAAKKYKTTYEIAEVLKISQPSVSRKLKKYKEKDFN